MSLRNNFIQCNKSDLLMKNNRRKQAKPRSFKGKSTFFMSFWITGVVDNSLNRLFCFVDKMLTQELLPNNQAKHPSDDVSRDEV